MSTRDSKQSAASIQGRNPPALPVGMEEFMAELGCLDQMQIQGLLSRIEFSQAKRQSLLIWLLANYPEMLILSC